MYLHINYDAHYRKKETEKEKKGISKQIMWETECVQCDLPNKNTGEDNYGQLPQK